MWVAAILRCKSLPGDVTGSVKIASISCSLFQCHLIRSLQYTARILVDYLPRELPFAVDYRLLLLEPVDNLNQE